MGQRVLIGVVLSVPVLAAAPSIQGAVTIDWVTVGNPGNAADTATGRGAVDYTYQISTYEVTNAQYVAFLNAVDPTGTNTRSLYNPLQTSDARGGVLFDAGEADGTKYSIKASQENQPVVFVSWHDGLRFSNWLHNGQGNGDTETGAYTLTDSTIVRSSDAKFVIPSSDEWYKAAYHQPADAGGDADGYWLYPTQTNSAPTSAPPSATNNTANFYAPGTGFAKTGVDAYGEAFNYLTDVGAYSDAGSFYGTFDQGGNVWEWTESMHYVGGAWPGTVDGLASTYPFPGGTSSDALTETFHVGFRIAAVPEPSAAFLGMSLAGLMLLRRKRNGVVGPQ